MEQKVQCFPLSINKISDNSFLVSQSQMWCLPVFWSVRPTTVKPKIIIYLLGLCQWLISSALKIVISGSPYKEIHRESYTSAKN